MTIAVSTETLDRPPDQVADPAAAVTITVQITVPNGVLPLTARRLVDDLRSLTETAADLSHQGPALEREPETSVEWPSTVDGDRGEPQLRLVGAGVRSAVAERLPGVGRPSASGPGEAPWVGRADRSGAGLTEPLPVLYLETGSRTVWCDGVAVHLSRREYDLLSYLCRNPRRVFCRAQLLRNVWGYEMVGGERTVDVHIRRLRAKLGGCAEGIVTVRGIGYRFDDQAAVAVVVDTD